MKTKQSIMLVSAVAVIMATGPAQGSVIVNDLNQTISGPSVYQFDLNGDGNNDFSVSFETTVIFGSPYTLSWEPVVSALPATTGAATQSSYLLGNVEPNGSSSFSPWNTGTAGALPLTGGGVTIDSSYLGGNTVDYGYMWKDDYGNANPTDTGGVVGGWSGTSVSDGFVGLEVVNSNNSINYGWAELQFNYNGGSSPTITLLKTGYNSVAGEGIVTPVPEPSSAALAGLAGILAVVITIRRKSKS